MIKDITKIEVDPISEKVIIQFKNGNILQADNGSLSVDITPKYYEEYNIDIKICGYGKLYPPEKKILNCLIQRKGTNEEFYKICIFVAGEWYLISTDGNKPLESMLSHSILNPFWKVLSWEEVK